MKRSEMIKILQSSFIEHMNCVDCCNTDDQMYNKILGDIEQAGMMPPAYNLNEGCDAFGIPSYYVDAWEDEDEIT